MAFILGKKIKMAQIFKNDKVIPVTLIEAGPCFVSQVKTKEKDKYQAVQIGFEQKKENKIKKSEKDKAFRYLKEFRDGHGETNKMKQGDKIDLSIFKEGEKVKISGISKGKGFQGGVKRWGFAGRNATHGAKHEARTIGSIGHTGPQRVFKGKKMPGQLGAKRITLKNLKIEKIDREKNLLIVRGAVPGRKGTILEIRN